MRNIFSGLKLMSGGRPRWNAPTIIFVIALVLRFGFLLAMPAIGDPDDIINQIPDTLKYINAADYMFGRNDTGGYDLFLVGPGYPLFIGLMTTLFGQVYWLILIIQIILGSLSSVLIYKISELLIKNRTISFIAGILSAVSLTSISLANSLLTETLFFFFMALMLYLFFKGLGDKKWLLIILAGVCGGLAVLVRSVAMFFPPLLIVFAVIYPLYGNCRRRQFIFRAVVAAAIMLSIPSIWGLKNYSSHDTFVISGTGAGAARLYFAARVMHTGQAREPWTFRAFQDSLHKASQVNIKSEDYKKDQDEALNFMISAFNKFPRLFIKEYILTIWDNVTVVSSLHYLLIPKHREAYDKIDRTVYYGFSFPVMIILSLLGFVILARQNLWTALILLMILIYFALLSGFTFGQGSRIFYPAQLVQAILAAAGLLFLYDLGGVIFRLNKPADESVSE